MNQTNIVKIGDLLTRPKVLGFVSHSGVAVGSNAVIHNTPEKGEHLATMHEFSAGKAVQVHHTGANPAIVVARSREILANPQKYHPIGRNCEHTAYDIIQGIAKSPQVLLGILIGVVVLLFLCGRR